MQHLVPWWVSVPLCLLIEAFCICLSAVAAAADAPPLFVKLQMNDFLTIHHRLIWGGRRAKMWVWTRVVCIRSVRHRGTFIWKFTSVLHLFHVFFFFLMNEMLGLQWGQLVEMCSQMTGVCGKLNVFHNSSSLVGLESRVCLRMRIHCFCFPVDRKYLSFRSVRASNSLDIFSFWCWNTQDDN